MFVRADALFRRSREYDFCRIVCGECFETQRVTFGLRRAQICALYVSVKSCLGKGTPNARARTTLAILRAQCAGVGYNPPADTSWGTPTQK